MVTELLQLPTELVLGLVAAAAAVAKDVAQA